MTAGEHGDGGFGRDEWDHTSPHAPAGGHAGWAGPQWQPTPQWPSTGGDPADYHQQSGHPSGDRGAHQRADHQGGYGYRAADDAYGGYGESGGATWRGDRTEEQHRREGSTGWHREIQPERTGAGGRGEKRSGRRRGLPLWQELPLLLIIAFCLALLVRTFLLQAFYIPSGSMEDTLLAGDRVLVNKVVYHAREPARGEVVVFRGTDAWAPQHAIDSDIGMFSRIGRAIGDLVGVSRPTEKDYIKRIVGMPGDRVSCCDVNGRVFVNGQPLDEDYVIFDAPLDDPPEGGHDCRSRRFDEVVVEPGQMFVLGDHRAVSQDSRCQGQVPLDNVIGRAFVIAWPSSRWASLSAPDTFAEVPRASGGQVQHVPVEPALVVPILLAAAAAARGWRVADVGAVREAVGSRSD